MNNQPEKSTEQLNILAKALSYFLENDQGICVEIAANTRCIVFREKDEIFIQRLVPDNIEQGVIIYMTDYPVQ
jgi:hypothetical protein